MSYRAICSNCMQPNQDKAADRCPHCKSRRLVVVSGVVEHRQEYKRHQLERRAAGKARAAQPKPALPQEPEPGPGLPEPGPGLPGPEPNEKPLRRGETLIASLGEIVYDRLRRRAGINEEIVMGADGTITAPMFAVMELSR